MLLANRVAAVIVFVLGLVVGVAGLKFSLTSEFGPGPGFWPAWLSVAWLALALVWFVETYRKKEDKVPFYSSSVEMKRLTTILLIFLVYVILLGVIGFLPATLLFLFTVLYLFEKRPLVGSIINSVIISVGLFLLFDTFLKVDLPKGLLNF
ncbi:MAG: tripartite tricarboxylate transporter TctB family protein [Bacillota bacterium]